MKNKKRATRIQKIIGTVLGYIIIFLIFAGLLLLLGFAMVGVKELWGVFLNADGFS